MMLLLIIKFSDHKPKLNIIDCWQHQPIRKSEAQHKIPFHDLHFCILSKGAVSIQKMTRHERCILLQVLTRKKAINVMCLHFKIYLLEIVSSFTKQSYEIFLHLL